MQLQTKRVLIVGGGGGLGRAVAKRLSSAGARIVVADLDLGAAREAADGLAPTAAIHIDVLSPASVNDAFSYARESLGGLDVMVYCVGIARHRPITEASEEDWSQVIATNLTGGFRCCQQAALEFVRQGGGGSIIAIASVASVRHGSGTSIYSASKAGLAAFVRAIAVDLAPMKVRANVVDPGPIDTALVRSAHAPAFRQAYERAIPMGRYGEPHEVAGAVLFLASDEASYVTGSTITVDGGFSHAGAIA